MRKLDRYESNNLSQPNVRNVAQNARYPARFRRRRVGSRISQGSAVREELSALYERAGITPREGLRAKEPLATELGLTRPDVTDDEILDAMVQHPILIERPLVETANGVRLCRPQDWFAKSCRLRNRQVRIDRPMSCLDPRLLLQGYATGIFPMADSRDADELFWVEPRQRAIIPLDGFHLSRSLRRTIRSAGSQSPRTAISPA